MTDVRITTPRNRLAKILHGLGGRTIADMSSDASARVAKMADEMQIYAANQVEELLNICRQGEVAMLSESRSLSALAMNIAETASVGEMPALGEAARGVCTLMDALTDSGVWHTAALEAHIKALVLFSSANASTAEEASRVLGQLGKLREVIGIRD